MTANGPVTFWEPSDKVRSDAVEATCTRRLSGHGKQSLQQKAQELADEASRGGEPDWYGTGGVVTEVEAQVCDLFGAEAAVLLPTGTMAQAIALRLHARDRDLPVVGMHPMSHPVLWEEDALTHLHGVEIREDPELQDLSGLAAVLVELPRRETGGHLMGFDELVTLSLRCADAGVALHLDGARLWQCGPAYAPKTLGEVVRLADTTYVSLYKDLGGAAGALLVCGHDQAVEVRSWRHRQGGTTFGLWPLALGARRGLREHLPRMPLYVEAARALGEVLEVVTPPVAAMLHVVLEGEQQRLADALVDVAAVSGTWLGGGLRTGPREGTAVLEISCGEATLAVQATEVAELLQQVSRLACAGPGASALRSSP